MQPKSLFESLDPEIGERMVTRRDAITKGVGASSTVMAGLAMASIPVALAALAKDLFAQGGLPLAIVNVLNFALTLEYLEAEFYQTGVGTSGLLPADVRGQFDQIRKHEVAHVEFLKQVLGSKAVSKPAFDYTAGMGRKNGPFADVFSNPATFAAVAQAFEDTGVRAYKGQAANLMSNGTVLQAALQIHSVEARHAAQVRRIRQQKSWITENYRGNLPGITQPIYNGDANKFHFILAQPGHGNSMSEAFDETLTSAQVLSIVSPFIARS
jgi:rubrerythrin